MVRALSLAVVAFAVAFAAVSPAAAGPTIKLKLQPKPLTAKAAKAIASFAMSESAVKNASDSKARSYGVGRCTLTKTGRANCTVDLKVTSARLQGRLTITPGYGRVNGRAAITSFTTRFALVHTCYGGACGPPKQLDITGSLRHRWNPRRGEYDEAGRSLRQVVR